MGYQNISYQMPAEQLNEIMTAINEININMPFLVTLDSSERQALLKLGPKSADFVADARSAAGAFPQVLPASFDVAEFNRDTSLFANLSEIKLLIDSLQEKIDHTYMAVGSESMRASLEVYAYVQTASDRTPGLKTVADKLKDRFKGQGRRGPIPASGSTPAE